MFRFAKWKIFSIIGMTLVAMQQAAPGARAGEGACAQIVLEVDQEDVARTYLVNLRDDVRRLLRAEDVRVTGGIGLQGLTIQFRVPETADRARVLPKLRLLAQRDSAGEIAGVRAIEISEEADGLIRMTVADAAILQKARGIRDPALAVLLARLDSMSLADPLIERQGKDRIVVQAHGQMDAFRLRHLLQSPARIEIRLFAAPHFAPIDVDMLSAYSRNGDARETYPVEKQPILLGEDLMRLQIGTDTRSGEPTINFRVNLSRGNRYFRDGISKTFPRFAIVFDNRVLSEPPATIRQTGHFLDVSAKVAVEIADDLAILLRSGALPAKMKIVDERPDCPANDQVWIAPDNPG